MLPLPHPPRTADSEFDLLSAEPCTINRIIAICVREWSYFGGMTSHKGHKDKVGHTETQNGYYQKVGEYWKQGTGTNLNGKNTDSAWSATFISYVMKQAGVPDRLF